MAESLRYEPWFIDIGFSILADFYSEDLYRNYTMKELIWGYHDPLMKSAMKLLPNWFYTDYVGVYAGVSIECSLLFNCFE